MESADEDNPDRGAATPEVWVLRSRRAGEATQLTALAEALGRPYEVKTLNWHRRASLAGLLRLATAAGVERRTSSPVRPPWPDLLITTGLRNEPVARWIRAQAAGKTRVVAVGRTWAGIEHFDLLITTPQYRIGAHPNVLQNTMTLQNVTPERLQEAAARWQGTVAALPAPRIAVFAGGNSGPYTLGPRTAHRLGQAASALARAKGASLLVSTSARTGSRASEALSAAIDVPAHRFCWEREAENPYLGYLALADEIIVTGDSIAMLSEACATGKPVHIFDLGRGGLAMRGFSLARVRIRDWLAQDDFRLTAFLYWLLMRVGPLRLTRDLSLVHRRLVEEGRAVWLGDPLPAAGPEPGHDVDRAVRRVHNLL